MKKSLREIGFRKALKFAVQAPLLLVFDFLVYPPLRVFFLRLLGAKIGKNVVMGRAGFANVYRTGFKGLTIGDNCVIDDYVVFDLANRITLEKDVTLAFGTTLVTHLNVGYKDHPLQTLFPKTNGNIFIAKGCFVGANVTILNGVVIGENSFVAAGSVVNKNVDPWTLVGGVPAKRIRPLKITGP